MSCNYVQHPTIERDQCQGEPAYRVMHRVEAPFWYETCCDHLADAVAEVMQDSSYVVVYTI